MDYKPRFLSNPWLYGFYMGYMSDLWILCGLYMGYIWVICMHIQEIICKRHHQAASASTNLRGRPWADSPKRRHGFNTMG